MAKRATRRRTNTNHKSATSTNIRRHTRNTQSNPEEIITTAEKMAMAAFSSSLKLVAAFGAVAAKSASLALESLASGADRFSDLVRKETLRLPERAQTTLQLSKTKNHRRTSRKNNH